MSVKVEYTGTLAAGETLVIDFGNETALLDGADASTDITGFEKVFELKAGANTVTYEDSEGSRNLAVTIEFTERHL